MLHQEVVDDEAQLGGDEAPIHLLHVAPGLDGGDDRRVGGGPADAVLLQRLDQTGLGVARRRLGEVLLRDEPHQVQDPPLG